MGVRIAELYNLDTINILCATDEHYVPYCGIMLTSLFENNKACHFNVYIFASNDVSEANEKKYNKLGDKYGHVVCVMRIEDSKVKEFYLNKYTHITLTTYFRLFVADLLPLDVHKVLYLDCDCIVVGGVVPLWETNVEGKALAGVTNRSNSFGSHCERLGYPVSYDYFNAGVLVINLQYWRENQVRERLVDYAVKNGSNLVLMDQDVLNGVLYDKKVLVSERYNFQILLFETKR